MEITKEQIINKIKHSIKILNPQDEYYQNFLYLVILSVAVTFVIINIQIEKVKKTQLYSKLLHSIDFTSFIYLSLLLIILSFIIGILPSYIRSNETFNHAISFILGIGNLNYYKIMIFLIIVKSLGLLLLFTWMMYPEFSFNNYLELFKILGFFILFFILFSLSSIGIIQLLTLSNKDDNSIKSNMHNFLLFMTLICLFFIYLNIKDNFSDQFLEEGQVNLKLNKVIEIDPMVLELERQIKELLANYHILMKSHDLKLILEIVRKKLSEQLIEIQRVMLELNKQLLSHQKERMKTHKEQIANEIYYENMKSLYFNIQDQISALQKSKESLNKEKVKFQLNQTKYFDCIKKLQGLLLEKTRENLQIIENLKAHGMNLQDFMISSDSTSENNINEEINQLDSSELDLNSNLEQSELSEQLSIEFNDLIQSQDLTKEKDDYSENNEEELIF